MNGGDFLHCTECGREVPEGLPRGLCPHCALGRAPTTAWALLNSPFVPDANPQLPRSVGDYEIVEEIARGGMGVVYKARQISLDRIVALKMIRSGQFASKEEVLRFQVEAESAAKLQHPNIVRIHETGEVDGQPFFSMDYVQGGSFADLVREGPLPGRRAATYVKKIALAIHYAHGHGILHRDLKPSNALLDDEDEPRITDFGLAKRAHQGSFLTNSMEILGAPSFMPPEQAGGKGKAGRYSDVYGLGAILYFLITARAPFQGESLVATLAQVINNEPVSPSLLNPAVPIDLETICLKCLEKIPGRRYATAQEVADELTRFLEDKPIAARPVSAGEKFWRWCHRNPQLSSALAAAVMLFAIGFATSLWQWRRAREKADGARLNLYVADMNLAHQALRQRNYSYALEKLRSQIPKNGEQDLRGWEWRYLWKCCQPNELFSAAGDTPLTTAAFSPDGTSLAIADKTGNIVIWDPIRRRRLTNLAGSPYRPSQHSIDFSPAGFLAAINQGRVFIFQPGTWQMERILTPDKAGALFSVIFLADGSNVVATSSSGLHAWKISGEREVPAPIPFKRDCRHLAASADGNWLVLSSDGSVSGWNIATRTRVLNYTLGPEQISTLTVSSNGLLAVCDRRGVVRIWNLPRLDKTSATEPETEWDTHGGTIFTAAFAPDESVLATGGSDQSIHLWTTATWEKLASFQGHNREIWSLAFSADGTQMASGGKDGAMKLWDAHERSPADSLDGTRYPLRFSPDSRTIAALTRVGRRLQFWDTATCTLQREFRPETNLLPVFIEITPDLRSVVMKAQDSIHVLDAVTGRSAGVLALDPAGLRAALPRLCSPDSRFVPVTTERDSPAGKVSAVELFSLDSLQRVKIFHDLAWPLCFSEDNRFIAGRTAAGRPAVWDIAAQRVVFRPEGQGNVSSLAFSWDGKWLAVATEDDVIRLWDMRRLRLAFALKGHREGIGRIGFSRDNRTLFSTSTDDTVRLWNLGNGQEMLSLTDYGTDTFELLVSPDDSIVAVSGLDFESPPIKLWRAPSLKEIDGMLLQTGPFTTP